MKFNPPDRTPDFPSTAGSKSGRQWQWSDPAPGNQNELWLNWSSLCNGTWGPNDHLSQNNHWLHWTLNIKHWTLNIDLQGLHWNLLEPHLWRVGKSTWLGRAVLDEASENNDYLENQHLARPTWEPGRELEELQGEERDASWKLMLLLSLILRLVLQNLQSVSYLIFFFWRLLFHNWVQSNVLESAHWLC